MPEPTQKDDELLLVGMGLLQAGATPRMIARMININRSKFIKDVKAVIKEDTSHDSSFIPYLFYSFDLR